MRLISYVVGELFTTVRIGDNTSTDKLFEVPTDSNEEIFAWIPSNLSLTDYQAQSGVDTFPNPTLLAQIGRMSNTLSNIYFGN